MDDIKVSPGQRYRYYSEFYNRHFDLIILSVESTDSPDRYTVCYTIIPEQIHLVDEPSLYPMNTPLNVWIRYIRRKAIHLIYDPLSESDFNIET